MLNIYLNTAYVFMAYLIRGKIRVCNSFNEEQTNVSEKNMALIDLAENVNNSAKDFSVPWLGHYLKNRG